MFSHNGVCTVDRRQWSSTSDLSPLPERYRLARSWQIVFGSADGVALLRGGGTVCHLPATIMFIHLFYSLFRWKISYVRCRWLYVTDYKHCSVHRVEPTWKGGVMSWPVAKWPIGVSVNGDRNVLITSSIERKLQIFTPHAELLSEVSHL